MPNHIQNEIKFNAISATAEAIKEIRQLMMGEESKFDFNKLIPMPDHIFCGNLGVKEYAIYGTDNWYDWSIENWGTKWNSYEVNWSNKSVRFWTAWESVPKIVKELSRRFPNVKMTYSWADEDVGYNVGESVYLLGEEISHFEPTYGTKEAYRLAFRVWDGKASDFGMKFSKAKDNYISDPNW